MKRYNSTLNQYTPLKSNGVKLKKTPLNKVSNKQHKELKLRRELKTKLIHDYGNICMTCKGKNTDWRGLTLSHIVPLSRGGLTVKSNCIIECFPDHELYEKQPEKRDLNIYPYQIIIKEELK